MNVMDILSEMGERPLSEYTWGALLVSHLNTIAGGNAITTRMSGTEVKSLVSTLPAEKQLPLYELQLPPLERASSDSLSSLCHPTTDPEGTALGRSQRTYYTAISVGTVCIVIGLVGVAFTATVMTSSDAPFLAWVEEFITGLLNVVSFVFYGS